jgi:glycogen synthase
VNGILKKRQFQNLAGHAIEKQNMLKKLFNIDLKTEGAYDQFILFGFIGRICHQKGVLILLEICEEIIKSTCFKSMFVIGGMTDGSEYSDECLSKLAYLCKTYPQNIWASPKQFFTEGLELTLAADFFLMPSLFEPGGIVQHEALVAGTPVIAFHTGGLKDSITDFTKNEILGNGLLFTEHSPHALRETIKQAIQIYKTPHKYSQLRKNCLTSFIDLGSVVEAWRGEMYRLCGKSSVTAQIVKPSETILQTHLSLLSVKEYPKPQIRIPDPFCGSLRVYLKTGTDSWQREYDFTFDKVDRCWVYFNLPRGTHE